MFQPFQSWIVEFLTHLVVNLVRHPAVGDQPKSFRPFEGRIGEGTVPIERNLRTPGGSRDLVKYVFPKNLR